MRAARLLAAGAAAWCACIAAWPATKADEEPPEVRYAAMLEAEYGPLGRTTEQILGREATHERTTIVSALVYRLRSKPLAQQSAVEKRLLAVYGLKEEVDNGGFAQYFSGPVGDGAALALQALKDMQAAPLLRTLQKALAVFPASRPPVDTARRIKVIEAIRRRASPAWAICDEEFYLREDGLADFAFAYAKKNRSQIVLP